MREIDKIEISTTELLKNVGRIEENVKLLNEKMSRLEEFFNAVRRVKNES